MAYLKQKYLRTDTSVSLFMNKFCILCI